MTGPIPKPAALRQRRNVRPSLSLPPVDPDRPVPVLSQDRAWRDEVIRWWCLVWQSPVSTQWDDIDVPAVEQLALLLDRWYEEQDDGGEHRGAGEAGRESLRSSAGEQRWYRLDGVRVSEEAPPSDLGSRRGADQEHGDEFS